MKETLNQVCRLKELRHFGVVCLQVLAKVRRTWTEDLYQLIYEYFEITLRLGYIWSIMTEECKPRED